MNKGYWREMKVNKGYWREMKVNEGYWREMKAAALKHGIRNPETKTESRKRDTESVKEVPSERFEKKNISNDNKINEQIKKGHK